MHGRMDSDDEESDNSEDKAVSEIPDSGFDLESSAPPKFGSDTVEVDPENDPIRLVSRRASDVKHVATSATAVSPVPKKNVKSMTLAERLLLDKKVNDGQRVEVSSRHFSLFNSFGRFLRRRNVLVCA
jgi:hypothetical protein